MNEKNWKMSRKGIFKRDTLLRNLNGVIERIPQFDLPVNIVSVYAFGGILREKQRLHDFDLVFLYSMTSEQKARWDHFRNNFSTYELDTNRRPLLELVDIFEPYRMRGIPLREAVKDEVVAKFLLKKDIPPQWAGCFSWTDIFIGPHGNGKFHPDLASVIRRMLIGKKFRGLQVFIKEYESFIRGDTSLDLFFELKNYVLAWSPEKPNIKENIENRPLEEKIQYAIKELDLFINEKIPLFKQGTELEKGYLVLRESLMKDSVEAGIKIDLDALDNQHINIQKIGSESHQELLEKLESARGEMRKYRDEMIVLDEISESIQRLKHSGTQDHEGYISLWVIEGAKKRGLKVNKIREILRILKLPEHNVITIKGYKFTYHVLSKNEEDKKRLIREAELEYLKNKYIVAILKHLRPLDKEARVYLELNNEKKPKSMKIVVWKNIESYNEENKKSIIDGLRMKGYEVEDMIDNIEIIKQVNVEDKENLKQLQDIAKQIILNSYVFSS